MKKLLVAAGIAGCLLFALFAVLYSFPRPYRGEIAGVEPALAYAVMKAESGFREEAESEAGAVGLMQLMPSTAAFICSREGIPFERERLKEGAYNVRLGCLYLGYLMERFEEDAALAAYNAGEGTVSEWLADPCYSADGKKLERIPYPETARYVKKVKKFRKIYEILY